MKMNKQQYAYIIKGSYYYRPESEGYTTLKSQAGVYTIEEAIKHVQHCSDLKYVLINIEEHNALIQNEINDLQSRIINKHNIIKL